MDGCTEYKRALHGSASLNSFNFGLPTSLFCAFELLQGWYECNGSPSSVIYPFETSVYVVKKL